MDGGLNKNDIQYQVKFDRSRYFGLGQKVFLKSNPELPLTVTNIGEKYNTVEVSWMDKQGCFNETDFPPECLLPYEYAGLIIIKEKHYICLN